MPKYLSNSYSVSMPGLPTSIIKERDGGGDCGQANFSCTQNNRQAYPLDVYPSNLVKIILPSIATVEVWKLLDQCV